NSKLTGSLVRSQGSSEYFEGFGRRDHRPAKPVWQLEEEDDARGGARVRAPPSVWGRVLCWKFFLKIPRRETYPEDERVQGRHGGYDPSTYQ
ncbi:hypothetical protein DVH24_025952, partial [Malus domestica]